MLQAFRLLDGLLVPVGMGPGDSPPTEALWIDLLRPTQDERDRVARVFGELLPTEQGIAEIEASSRCFQDETGTHVRAYSLREEGGTVRTSTTAFLISDGRLFTVRQAEYAGLREFVGDAATTRGLVDEPFSLMLRMFEAQIDGVADILEGLHRRLERVGLQVREAHRGDMGQVIDAVAAERDVNDQARLSLMDKERVLSYLLRRELCPDAHLDLLREMLRDIDSLSAHSTFLFERIDALLGETIGRVSIEQNRIVKIFSVAAVALLPPTLIASLYGMNFRAMPELDWPWGYPMALGAMVLSGVAPYILFRRKGWL